MIRNNLRLILGVLLVSSHFIILLGILVLTFCDRFTVEELLKSYSVILPLFAAYSIPIVSFFVQVTPDAQKGERSSMGRTFFSLFIPSCFVVFVIVVVAMKAFGNLTFDNYLLILGVTETAFGVYIGLIVRSLFEGGEKAKSSRELGTEANR